MSFKKLNQKGFSGVEALLIIIILAILGGTGYYVYHANSKATDTQNSAQTNANTVAPHKKKASKKTADTTKATVSDKEAVTTVIADYMKANFDANSQITYQYDVTDITGSNARGGVTPSEGDHQLFMAHKENDVWKIVFFSHQPPTIAQPDICAKYGAPASWCTNPW